MSDAAKMDLDHEEDDKNAILADEMTVYEQPDPYYRTCCGKVHVETAAKYIAIVCLVFQLTAMLYSVMFMVASRAPMPPFQMLILQIVLFGIGIYIHVAILIALKKRVARYYWPFLAYNALSFVVSCIAVVAILVMFIKYHDKFPGNQVVIVAMIIASSFAQLLLCAWMEMVVYKAYKFMLYHHNGSHNRMMQYNNQIFSDDPIKV